MDPSIPMYVLGGGVAVLAVAGLFLGKRLRHERSRLQEEMEARAQAVLSEARAEADRHARESRLLLNEEIAKLRDQAEQAQSRRRLDLDDLEKRLAERERLVNQQLERFVAEEARLREHREEARQERARLDAAAADNEKLRARLTEDLSRMARLSPGEARELVLRQAREETLRDAADLTRHLLEEARRGAEEKARQILATVVQRYAGEYTFESTTTSLAIANEEIKGRIIGREGRNIRAFEMLTGVTVLIDDTPNAVVISGFDPVRRAVAREAMARLIADGRIHPTRIEEVVAQVERETEETVLRLGDEAVGKLGLTPVHTETARLLGRLRFRHSFSQNILDHSLEVARLSGLLAAELGLDAGAAKRAGLLHDIGKAVSHDLEGPHALVGARLLLQHGEDPQIVNAVASHHQEAEYEGPLGVIVSAADAISASRPGARSESMTTYLKRVEGLERIGTSFRGVDKCFAVQAGRELRVIVRPNELEDAECVHLARAICRRIEDEIQYPGQIRVTLVRETRCIEYAK